MMRYRRGWFGNPQGHAMAARGVRMYAARKPVLMDPVFYAQKREEMVPMGRLSDEVRDGATYQQLQTNHPDADKEDLRIRGIKALESREGSNVLSMLNNNGVDESLKAASNNPRLRYAMEDALKDGQKSSFLQSVKVDLLKQRLREVPTLKSLDKEYMHDMRYAGY